MNLFLNQVGGRKITYAFLCSLFFISFSFPGNLSSPIGLESASVLPKGVGNPQLKNIFTRPDSKFNSSGVNEELGSSLNKTLSWSDLVQAQSGEKDQNLLKASVESQGFNLSDSPGSTVGEVNMSLYIFTPVLAYGVTDRLTLAVAAPIYNVQTSVDTGFIKSEQGQTWLNKTYESEPLTAHQASEKLSNPVTLKARDLNYEPLENQKFSSIGDVKLIAKYLAYEQGDHKFAFKSDLTIPTGRAPNSNQLVDVPTGDGQVDLGAFAIYDYQIFSGLKWNTYTGYTHQFADQIERRIPERQGDPLSIDSENVSRKLGDQVTLGTGFLLGSSTRGFGFGGGYSLQYLFATKYYGEKFSQERYRYLEGLSPSQTLHSLTTSLTFATIDWYKEKKFFYPLQVGLTYSYPLSGRNTLSNPIVVADLVLFF